ncbi:MAG TPA: helix-turn-helix domain-containing protein [Tangfeifania sp.]|nr:helix-turn-helix domain-containing protein [Tangfeifania sp.]
MKNFIKYLTSSREDENWGIFLTSAGSLKIPPQTEYPSQKHPGGYFFTWENGRVLQEYQVNYITEGGGILENTHGIFELKKGDVMITFPGEWHRYKPQKLTGWTENYIGFNGPAVSFFLAHNLFDPKSPVIQTGNHEEILDGFLRIFELVKAEPPGFQQIASGMVIKLLGYLVAYHKQKEFSGKEIAGIIEKARFEMRNDVDKQFDLEQFAANNNIGYSYFRRMFKNFTGISPRQYFLQLKILRARELLLTTDKSIKEISYQLGFDSIYYFSRFFKQKTGMSPSELRK